MKKILLFASALAGLFLAGCQRENLEPQKAGQQVSFIIEAPAAIQTKAIADGLNVNELIYEVWITEGQNQTDLSGATRLYQARTDMKQDGDRMKANITLDLVNDQNFTVLFWAQKSGIGVYNTDWLNAVTYTNLNEEAYAANDNRLDAFYSKAFVVDCQTATPTVTLKRPFAQVNLCTLNNKEAAQQAGDYNITLVSSKMRLDAVPTVFNVATSDATNYVAMEFLPWNVPSGDDEKITVNGKEYYYAGMNYVFAGANILLTYDIQTKLNGTVDANVNNTIQNVPLKENYRTNIVGNLLTSKTDYEIIVDAAFNEPDYGEVYSVTTDEQLKKALTTDAEIINIILGADLNISSGDVSKLGGPKTKKIIIDGSQILTRAASADVYTLNINTTYDARFYAVNPEATIVLKNLKLTNSKASGTWDTYDIMFNNDVEFENVHALKPLAFTGENKTAKLQNVTIDELNNDYYALWICAKGTNVEWNGGAVNSPKGRGIKIDEQYVKNPAATTLKVTGVDFNTAKKGAILVKSSAETNIEVSDVNIVDVIADPINAVWVDEDAAEHFDLVTVTGASKVLEGAVKAVLVYNAEELQEAIDNAGAGVNEIGFGADITGNVTILQKVGVDVIVNGLGKKFDGTFYLEGGQQGESPETITFKNINFEHTAASALDFISCDDAQTVGKRYAHNTTVEDCSFTGNGAENVVGMRYRQCFKMTVKNSTATGLHSLMWTSGGNGIVIDNVTLTDSKNGASIGTSAVVVKNSDFNVVAYGIRADGKNSSLKVENTSINAKQPVIVRKMTEPYSVELAGENTLTSTELYQVIFTNGDDEADYVTPTGTYTITGADDFLVFPRDSYGDKVVDGLYKNDQTYNVTSAAGLKKLNEMFADQSAGRDAILSLKNDIDFTGYTWTPVDSHADSKFEIAEINGNGHTLSNLTINGQAMFKRFAGSGDVVVKNITFDNATVNSNGAINTSILTVQTYQNVLLDNVDVKNSSITGGYKVAPLIATVYNESSSTITATLKNCDVTDVTVKATSYDFCTTGMVAFVYASDNDTIEFENCTVTNVKLYAPNVYTAHAAIYTTGSETLFNEAEGVTVTNVTFENI